MAKRKVRDLQTNFTAGLLDDLMFGRVDTRLYRNGASVLENWLQLAQGGIRRRPGTRFFTEFSSGEAEEDFPRLAPFVFSEDQAYLLAFTPGQLDIIELALGTIIQTEAGPWSTNAIIDQMHFSQRGDTMIITHNSFAARRLLRIGATAFDLDLFFFEDTGLRSLEPFFKFADPGVTLQLGATSGATTATSSQPHFSAGHVGSRLRLTDSASNTFEMGITGFTSPTLVNVAIRGGPFANTNATTEWVEAVWSAHNGFARAVTFHGQRLWMSGGNGLPSHLFSSHAGGFFNFDVGTGEPDESVQGPLAADQVNNIHHLVSGERLFVMTDQGIFFVAETDESPITPASFNPRRVSRNGSTNKVRPLIYDDEVIYVERGQVGVRKLFNDEFTTRIRNESVTLVMADKITGVFTQVATMDALEDRPENYAFFVTSEGDIFVYHSISTENLQGWARWTTNGKFKSVAGIVDKLYISAYRTVNGVTKHWIEVLDEDVTVDAAIVSTLGTPPPVPSPAFIGFNVWLGQEIDIVIDGPDGTINNFYMGTTTPILGVGEPVPVLVVLPGNNLTLSPSELNYASRCVGGYGFPARLKFMPLSIAAEEGDILTEPKRTVSLSPILVGAYSAQLGTNRLEIRQTRTDFSADAIPFTGIHRFYHFGWSRRGDIQIDVIDPLDITILGASREVVF